MVNNKWYINGNPIYTGTTSNSSNALTFTQSTTTATNTGTSWTIGITDNTGTNWPTQTIIPASTGYYTGSTTIGPVQTTFPYAGTSYVESKRERLRRYISEDYGIVRTRYYAEKTKGKPDERLCDALYRRMLELQDEYDMLEDSLEDLD